MTRLFAIVFILVQGIGFLIIECLPIELARIIILGIF